MVCALIDDSELSRINIDVPSSFTAVVKNVDVLSNWSEAVEIASLLDDLYD